MNATKLSTALLLAALVSAAHAMSFASAQAEASVNDRPVQTSFSVTGPRENSATPPRESSAPATRERSAAPPRDSNAPTTREDSATPSPESSAPMAREASAPSMRDIVICRSQCCWSYTACGYVTRQRRMHVRSASCNACRRRCAGMRAYSGHTCWSWCWRLCRDTMTTTAELHTFRHTKLCPTKKVRGTCKKPMAITSRLGHRVSK